MLPYWLLEQPELLPPPPGSGAHSRTGEWAGAAGNGPAGREPAPKLAASSPSSWVNPLAAAGGAAWGDLDLQASGFESLGVPRGRGCWPWARGGPGDLEVAVLPAEAAGGGRRHRWWPGLGRAAAMNDFQRSNDLSRNPRDRKLRVDPKVFMANERTFLSWTRQGMALGGFGVGLICYGEVPPHHRPAPKRQPHRHSHCRDVPEDVGSQV